MTETETQSGENADGTVTPPEPSIEEELEPSGEQGIGVRNYEEVSSIDEDTDYEANVLHISDSEKDDPVENILEQYGEEPDIDAVIDSGDMYKLPSEVLSYNEEEDGEYEPEDFEEDELEEYIEGHLKYGESLSELQEELDIPVFGLYGNHDGVMGTHPSDDSDAFKQAVHDYLEEEFEDFEHENLKDYVFDKNGIEDITGKSVDVNGVRIVGGLQGVDVEADDQFFEDRDIAEFYDKDELENIAEELGSEKSYGILEKIPFIGKFFEYLGGIRSEDVEPEDLGLEEVPEELQKEGHKDYIKAKEEALEEYNEKRNAIETMIGEHEGPVVLAGHQDLDVESEYGSRVFTDLVEEYDNIVAIAGGHTHNQEVYEHEGTINVNSAETFSEIGVLENEAHVNQYDYSSSNHGSQQPTLPELIEEEGPEEAHSRINQQIEMMEHIMENEKLAEEEEEQLHQQINKAEKQHEVVEQVAEQIESPETTQSRPSPDSSGEDSTEEAMA